MDENTSPDEIIETPEPAVATTGAEKTALKALGIVTLVAIQVFFLVAFLNSRGRIADLEAELDSVQGEVWTVQRDLITVQDSVASVQSDVLAFSNAITSGTADGPQSPATADTAIAAFSADEYYSGTATTVNPGDGKARAILVWAHWCPVCQTELPTVKDWYAANGDSYPNTELVSIHAFERAESDNPLLPYLDGEQFPFPVFLDDESYALAIHVRNNGSVPSWTFTDGDGNVVGQHAGGLTSEQLDQVFAQLESLATGS
jgi:thiol-disulfide isomerase/thioredoxin